MIEKENCQDRRVSEQKGNIIMPLANFKELLLHAKKNHYAVPCLVAGNIEMAVGQIMAAEESKSPVIIGFPPHVMPLISSTLYMPFLIDAAERSSIPVAIQLDHGFEFDEIMRCIKFGVSAVMFDGSDLKYDDNVARTKEIVKVAHSLNVGVEAELGYVGGSVSDDQGKSSQMTDPDKVVDFISKTGVDALAVSIGNLHGKYKSEPKLDLDRLKKISSITETPLVLHGGSGLTDNDYKDLVKNGISDIHFYSYLAADVWPEVQKRSKELNRNPIYHEVIAWSIEYYYQAGKKVMDLLNSSEKADAICANSLYTDIIEKISR